MAQNLLNALTLGSLYLLFALGMSLAWGTIGILNFAHGSIFMFAAFTASVLVGHVALPMPAMIAVGVLVGAALSVLVQVLAFEPIQRRASSAHKAELQILVGGIGIAIIPLSIAQYVTKSVPFGYSAGTFRVSTYDLGLVRVSNVQLVAIVAALGLAAVIGWWLRAARPGLALRAIGALVLAGIETLVLVTTSGAWAPAIAFGVIFLMLLVRPNGLLGRQEVRRT